MRCVSSGVTIRYVTFLHCIVSDILRCAVRGRVTVRCVGQCYGTLCCDLVTVDGTVLCRTAVHTAHSVSDRTVCRSSGVGKNAGTATVAGFVLCFRLQQWAYQSGEGYRIQTTDEW